MGFRFDHILHFAHSLRERVWANELGFDSATGFFVYGRIRALLSRQATIALSREGRRLEAFADRILGRR
jgi:hypothetical protein